MKFIMTIILSLGVAGCVSEQTIKASKAISYKVDVEKLPDVSKLDLGQALSFVEGENFRFFFMKLENPVKPQILSISRDGVVKDLFKDLDRGAYATPMDSFALGDDLFVKVFLRGVGSNEVIELYRFTSDGKTEKLPSSFNEDSRNQLVKIKNGLLALGSLVQIISLKNGQINMTNLKDIPEPSWVGSQNLGYIYSRNGISQQIWRVHDANLEPEAIALPWKKGAEILSITHDPISGFFMISYLLKDQNLTPNQQATTRIAKMDDSGAIIEIGNSDGVKYSPYDSALVQGTYFGRGSAKNNSDNESVFMVINGGKTEILPRSDLHMGRFFQVGKDVYASEFFDGKLYKFRGDGQILPLESNLVTKKSWLGYYYNSEDIFLLRTEREEKLADVIYLINKETGAASPISLPDDVYRIEVLELCDRINLLTHGKDGQFTGFFELGAVGKLKKLDIPASLKNVRHLPSDDPNMFLIIGQETIESPWQSWKFTCQEI